MSTQRQPKGIPVGGQFAESAHDEAGSPLVASAGDDFVSPPAKATIRYEEWDDRDNAIYVGEEDLDLSTVLDAYDLDNLPDSTDYGETDRFYYDAWVSDLRTRDHGGPFTVDIDEEEYEEYIEARRAAGKEKAFRAIPLHSSKDRNKIVLGGYDRAFGTTGFIGVSNWKDERDARAWARGAKERIDEALESKAVERDRLDPKDAEIIRYVDAAASADENVGGNYLNSTQRIAYMIGDRMIEMTRPEDEV